MSIPSSFLCSMLDVRDRGAGAICEDLLALGVNEVTVSAVYHAARDLRPRPGGARLADTPDGARYFPSGEAVAPGFAERDLLAELRTATAERGMTLTAWTVFGFDERLGRARPDLAQRTALGDAMTGDLCPANPEVQDRWLALAAEVADRDVDALLSESLHYAPLRLTRRFVPLDAAARLALGLCFCGACAAAAHADDVDLDAALTWARAVIEDAFAGRRPESTRTLTGDEIAAVAGGAVPALLATRCRVVTELTARVRAAVPALRVLDQAVAHEPALGPGPVAEAGRDGVDVAALGALGIEYEVLGYAPDAASVGAILADYRAAVGAGPMRVALRPSWPDCTDEADLAAKVDAALAVGVTGIDFYHWGFASADALGRVAAVLAARA